jgi:hypothetical protein
MGSVGLTNAFSSIGTPYDFKKMTNGQAVAAANQLYSNGKISQVDAETLQGFSCDTVRINGAGQPESTYSPTDPTQYNFLSMIEHNLAYSQSSGNTTAAKNDANLLQDLSSIQSSTL